MATAQEILAYTEKNVTDDVAKAEAFIKLFFSKEQKPTYEDNPEQQLKVITVLAAAQKSIEANKLKEALEAVKASIKPYKLLELYEIDSLKQHIHDEGIEVQALFSDEELAAAGYTKKGNTQTRTGGSTEKEMITTKIVDLKGAVVSVTIGKKGAVAKPKDDEPKDTYEFFQEVSRMNEGKANKDKITKESLSKSSPAEIAETFADYIAKVKAQAA